MIQLLDFNSDTSDKSAKRPGVEKKGSTHYAHHTRRVIECTKVYDIPILDAAI